MTKIIEAKAVISAADKTGQVFDSIAKKMKNLASVGKEMEKIKPPRFTGDMMAELKRLKLSERELQGVRTEYQRFGDALKGQRPKVEHYFRAINDYQDRTVQKWREIKAGAETATKSTDTAHRRLLSGAAMMAARGFALAGGAYGAYRVGKAGIKASAESQRESARDYLAGLTPAESARLKEAGEGASSRYQSVDATTMHERLRDTAMSTRSVDKALELSDTIGQMTTVLQSLKGKDKAVEEGRKFFAALDVLGKNIDPKEVRELADAAVKALGVEGADMDLGGYLQFARQSRAAGGILSNRFLATSMPGLARDLGDAQLGTSLSSSLSQNIGGRATKTSKAVQQAYGLRDKQGNFLDSRMAMENPDLYAWQKLMPAMAKKGVDTNDNVAVTKALAQLFSNRTVQDVFSKLITQREQYQGKAAQYARAPGLEGAGPLMGKDPFVALEAVNAQLRNLAAQAPVMEDAAAGLGKLSNAISELGQKVKENSGWYDTAKKKVGDWWANESRDWQAIKGGINSVLEFDKKTGIDPTWLGLGKKGYPAAEDPMGSDYTKRAFHDQAYWTGLGREGASASTAARLRREAAMFPGFSAPGVTQTMTYGTGLQNQSGIEKSANVTVQGDVHGEVEGLFKVEAGSELLRIVEEMKRLKIEVQGKLNSIGGNGPGSTGRSSPDAQAPGGTGFGGGGM